MKYVVVTGASTGIGRGTTRVLVEEGFHVFGSVRKQADAQSLKEEFGDKVTPLIFDVTDEAAVHAGAAKVKEAIGEATLSGLVNNAGIAVAGPLMHIPIADLRYQLEVNTVAPIIVTQAFLPLLGATNPPPKDPGTIVNISSVAGKNAAPFLGPYAASKHGLEALSESLRRELMIYGIDSVCIGPGAVATPIWDKAEEVDVTPYMKTDFAGALDNVRAYMIDNGPKGLPPEAIGKLVHEAITNPKRKVRYVAVPNYIEDWLIPRNLPKRTLDKVIGKRLGLKKLGS